VDLDFESRSVDLDFEIRGFLIDRPVLYP